MTSLASKIFGSFLALYTWSPPIEKNSMTGEELEKRNIAAMGEVAGKQYSLLNNEVAILHL